MDLLVNEAGSAGEGAGGQGVHQEAPGAGGADGDHLNEGHQNGDNGGGKGAEGEPADADDHVLEVKVQEAVDAGHVLGQEHHNVGDAGEHGDGHQGAGVHPAAGGRASSDGQNGWHGLLEYCSCPA